MRNTLLLEQYNVLTHTLYVSYIIIGLHLVRIRQWSLAKRIEIPGEPDNKSVECIFLFGMWFTGCQDGHARLPKIYKIE